MASMESSETPKQLNRFDFLKQSVGRGAALLFGWIGGMAVFGARRENTVWQIDPDKCVQC